MKNEGEQTHFSYPGKGDELRGWYPCVRGDDFFGDCLKSYPNPGEDGWDSDIRIVEVLQDQVAEKQLADDPAKLAQTRVAVRGGECREVSGITRSSEP